jgi:EAL domain-containing protein (putative c-di-GMP-specific phosphodiesterase class I)
VDELKVGRSSISQAPSGDNAAADGAATVPLAHGMGLNVVAEGVRKPEAWNLLER